MNTVLTSESQRKGNDAPSRWSWLVDEENVMMTRSDFQFFLVGDRKHIQERKNCCEKSSVNDLMPANLGLPGKWPTSLNVAIKLAIVCLAIIILRSYSL